MIRHGVVIDSLAFSFVDEAGEKHTIGPWGGPRGDNKDTVIADPLIIILHIFTHALAIPINSANYLLICFFPLCRSSLLLQRS
jgi:hypothetical protein